MSGWSSLYGSYEVEVGKCRRHGDPRPGCRATCHAVFRRNTARDTPLQSKGYVARPRGIKTGSKSASRQAGSGGTAARSKSSINLQAVSRRDRGPEVAAAPAAAEAAGAEAAVALDHLRVRVERSLQAATRRDQGQAVGAEAGPAAAAAGGVAAETAGEAEAEAAPHHHRTGADHHPRPAPGPQLASRWGRPPARICSSPSCRPRPPI